MKVIYSDQARQWSEGFSLLEQASNLLEEVLGPSADLTKVEWDRVEDAKGRILYALRLSDWAGSVTAHFAPNELQSLTHMRVRLYGLWGDLLQARSDKQLQELSRS